MQPLRVKIATDFSSTPGPRYIVEGDWSGELFRKECLLPVVKKAIEEKNKLIVDLDGTAGYGTSFLEESFGGLIREEKIEYSEIVHVLEIKSMEEDYLIEDIKEYLKDAEKKEQSKKNN